MTRTTTYLATALALALPAGALAEAHTGVFAQTDLQYGQTYLATSLIGQPVHAIEGLTPGMGVADGSAAEWERIGEIGDFIVGVDGSFQGVVIDVGGFLGMGEREVAIRWDALVPVFEESNPDDWLLTVPVTRETLDVAPEVDRDPT